MDAIAEEKHPFHDRGLMAIRFYLYAIMSICSRDWFDIANEANNYADLLYAIERWRVEKSEKVLFVTFNYDSLLERTLRTNLGWTIERPEHCISGEFGYYLFKLHGSVDWGLVTKQEFKEPRGTDLAHRLINEAPRLSYEPGLVPMSPSFAIDNSDTGAGARPLLGVVPALALPRRQKDEFVCPPEHVTLLAKALPSVTKILVIGWRATEAKFLKMIHEAKMSDLERVLAVCKTEEDSTKTARKLPSPVRGRGGLGLPMGFTELVESNELRDFLG